MNVPTTLYEILMRVRPYQLTDVLKTCSHIRRRSALTSTNHTFCVDPVSILGIHCCETESTSPK